MPRPRCEAGKAARGGWSSHKARSSREPGASLASDLKGATSMGCPDLHHRSPATPEMMDAATKWGLMPKRGNLFLLATPRGRLDWDLAGRGEPLAVLDAQRAAGRTTFVGLGWSSLASTPARKCGDFRCVRRAGATDCRLGFQSRRMRLRRGVDAIAPRYSPAGARA